jgi:PAS domain S-box-containing protein
MENKAEQDSPLPPYVLGKETYASLLDAVPAHIALLNSQGVIIFVNRAWRGFGHLNVKQVADDGIGQNYIAVCDQARGEGAEEAVQVAEGIREVLRGDRDSFTLEYPCHTRAEQRWFQLTVTPLDGARLEGVVVMHVDITERKLSEIALRDATAMLQVAGRTSSLGGWTVHLEDQRIVWTEETALIHDEALTFSPTVQQAINYYAPEHRERIEEAFYKCTHEGVPFDETLKFVSAKARRLWVRTIGEAVRDQAGRIIAVRGAIQDISELVESRELLRETIDALPAGIVLYDRDERLLMFNAMAAEVSPALKLPGAIGMTFEQLVHESTRMGAFSMSALEEEIVRFRSKSIKQVRQLADGRWFDCSEKSTPSGHTVGLRVDVTEIRALELEAGLARDQYQILVDSLSDVVFKLDFHKGVFTFVSRSASDFLATPVEKLVGAAFADFVLPEDHDRVRSFILSSRLAPQTTQEVGFRVGVPGGPTRFVEMRFRHGLEDTAEIVVGVIRDVTERKAAEQALALNEERFRVVAQLSANMVWDWDLIEDSIWRNDEGIARYGSKANTLRGWADQIHPDDRDRVVESWNAAVEGSKSEWTEEYRLMSPDGSYVQLDSRGSILRDDGGKAVRMIGSGVDVTERRRLEDKMLQSQKLESIGKLTGGVAHDFNNILMVIMANADVVLEDDSLSSEIKESIERISGAAERATQLTRQLLAFSRKQTLRPQLTNLNDLVAETGSMLRRTLGAHIEIQSLLSEDLWSVKVDRAQVESALVNLCVNARDAMPSGGVLLIETRNAALDADYVAHNPDASVGDFVMLSVTDSGVGMSPEVLSKVFEPFFTTKGVGKGTGLGLSMVYGFVRQSKGHVTIYSEVGHGTAIKLYLPRCEQEAGEEAIKPETRMPTGTERILLVEDENQVRAVVFRQLTSLGYTVSQAGDGAEGLAALRAGHSYDLLLTDVVMPGPINGKGLADEATKLYPRLRVLFMSGYSEEAISTLGILNPGIALLNKPFRKIDLAQAVRRAIDSKASDA